jgi:hypothetical protein
MDDKEPFPYCLPIWRRRYSALSPHGEILAEIPEAHETSMSNPTSGTLRLSTGLAIDHCNPSFIWSDDSRYLAVPQWRYGFGIQLRQRMLLVDTVDRAVYASRPLAWWLQPRSFSDGILVVDGEPTRKRPQFIEIRVPADLRTFRRLAIAWPHEQASEKTAAEQVDAAEERGVGSRNGGARG